MTTDRQDWILAFLREKPGASVREVGEELGLRSPSTPWEELGKLEKKGLIRRLPCPTCAHEMWVITDGEVAAEERT